MSVALVRLTVIPAQAPHAIDLAVTVCATIAGRLQVPGRIGLVIANTDTGSAAAAATAATTTATNGSRSGESGPAARAATAAMRRKVIISNSRPIGVMLIVSARTTRRAGFSSCSSLDTDTHRTEEIDSPACFAGFTLHTRAAGLTLRIVKIRMAVRAHAHSRWRTCAACAACAATTADACRRAATSASTVAAATTEISSDPVIIANPAILARKAVSCLPAIAAGCAELAFANDDQR